MPASLRQFVSVLMVAIFMVNLGLLNFQQLTMQHEYAHVSDVHHHEHEHEHEYEYEQDDHGASADGAVHADFSHELLHAAEHVQPLPTTFFGSIALASGGVEPVSFTLPTVPSMVPDSPFRPPRLIPQADLVRT